MEKEMDAYTEGHLIVAAIRILHHQSGQQPSIEEISDLLGVSAEHGNRLCRMLRDKDIVEFFEDPFSVKLAVKNHLLLEELPREEESGDSLSRELESFMAKKEKEHKKVESIQADLDKKKKSMFSDIEAQFKKQMQELNKDN